MTSASGGRTSVVDIVRELWRRFPAFRATLEHTGQRQQVIELLLTLYRAPKHNLDQCMAEVVRAGYFVSEHAPAPERRQEEEPSQLLLSPAPVTVPTSLSTLAGKLLVAFYAAGEAGLTADEAREAAKLSVAAGSWKRVSDLHNAGLIQYMVDEHDDVVRRLGPAGVLQQVCIITTYGRSIVTMLEGT